MVDCRIDIRLFKMEDYPQIFSLWERTSGVGVNEVDDSYEGVELGKRWHMRLWRL